MRAAAIFGLGCSEKQLRPFQRDDRACQKIEWRIGMPAASDEADVILLFGGDGTIHRHLSLLVGLRVPVLIVPAGSGNDFARALGLRSMRNSLAAWRRFCGGQGNVRAIDSGVVTPLADADGASAPHKSPSYFCSVAGVGLDAEVARRANGLPRWLRGHGGYALALGPALFRFAPVRMRILAPDESGGWVTHHDGLTTLAAFGNSGIYGGGMRIAPRAQMDDGKLDACVIGGIGRFKLASVFPTVYFGRHLGIREVDYFQAVSVRIETETPLDIYGDGEFVCQTPAEISVQRGALRVVVHESHKLNEPTK
jgi:diacylglycerol kinase (ATP)